MIVRGVPNLVEKKAVEEVNHVSKFVIKSGFILDFDWSIFSLNT